MGFEPMKVKPTDLQSALIAAIGPSEKAIYKMEFAIFCPQNFYLNYIPLGKVGLPPTS